MKDPEDDLPPWIYAMKECPVCYEVIQDSVPSYVLYDDFGDYDWLDLCKCEEE